MFPLYQFFMQIPSVFIFTGIDEVDIIEDGLLIGRTKLAGLAPDIVLVGQDIERTVHRKECAG